MRTASCRMRVITCRRRRQKRSSKRFLISTRGAIDPPRIRRRQAVWNETDPQRRRETLAALWAPEGVHYVGTREVQGYDALEQRITGSHEKNVRDGGHRFRVSAVHALQDAVVVDWAMVPSAGSAAVAAAHDVFIVDADHRILIDYQFIVG